MTLKEILDIIIKLSQDENISTTYICGGIPRDKLLHKITDKITDIDLTNGDKSISLVADKLYDILSENYKIKIRTNNDGHKAINIGNLKIDFSSNFIIPDIDKILLNIGIKNPTNILRETYSRDFTCNSLLMPLDVKKIIDPTNQGIKDINNKIIKTILSPDITLKYNPSRIPRLIYLAAKLDFKIDQPIIDWVKNNTYYLTYVPKDMISKKIEKALEINPDIATYYINKMDMWKRIPITNNIYPFFVKNKT